MLNRSLRGEVLLAVLLLFRAGPAAACTVSASASAIVFPAFTFSSTPGVSRAQGFVSVGDCGTATGHSTLTLSINGSHRSGGVDRLVRLSGPPGDGNSLPYRAMLERTSLLQPGKGRWQLVRIAVQYDERQALDLPAGTYSDRLVISVLP